MSTLTLAMRDSSTMVRRQLKRLFRYPSMTVQLVVTPVIILLLFGYVFGGTLGAGLGGGRDTYIN
jgi:ABC-2 type transport system permease protein